MQHRTPSLTFVDLLLEVLLNSLGHAEEVLSIKVLDRLTVVDRLLVSAGQILERRSGAR